MSKSFNHTYLIVRSFLLLLAVFTFVQAQTEVQGIITQDTWTPEQSPYLVTGDLYIDVLTIEPGVTVLFKGDYRFEINESLAASGVYSDSIYFRPSDDNTSGWQGIHLMPASLASQLAYCKISATTTTGLLVDNCETPLLSNCVISDNQGNGIDIKGSSAQLATCTIRDNKYKGIYLENAQVSAVNTIIARNNEGIYSFLPNDGIELTNSVIAANRNKSIICVAGMAHLENCILYGNDFELGMSDTTHVKATYSAIEQLSAAYPGNGNLNVNPNFSEDTSFQLASNSPCIDAGNPDGASDDLFFPPSQGAARNDMGAYGGPQAGNWLAPIHVEPQTIDFGKVTLDSTRSLALTLFNNRNQPLNLFQIRLSENADFFNLDTQQINLPAAGQHPLNIQFIPNKSGLVLADLVFEIMDRGTVTVPVSGEGIVARISVQNNNLSFPLTTIGAFNEQNLGLLNLGTDTLRIQRIWSPAKVFAATDTALNIAPGSGIVQTAIRFMPDSAISYADSLIIESNDPDQPRIAVPVSGSGQKGALLASSPTAIHFHDQLVLTDSTQTITLQNKGDLDLQINSITLSAPDTLPGLFSLINAPQNFPLVLRADSSYQLLVRFAPLTRGPDGTWLRFTSNDALHPQDSLWIDGRAIAPVIGRDVQALNFDSVAVGVPALQKVVLSNDGDAPLHINSIRISDLKTEPASFYFADSLPPLPLVLDIGEQFELPVRFSPQFAGPDSARLRVGHDDPFADTLEVRLYGFGVAPKIAVSGMALDFSGTVFSAYSDRLLTIFNNGTQPLELPSDSLYFSGPDTAHFKIIDQLPPLIAIAPGEDLSLTLRFLPKGAGPRYASLHIFCNDPFTPQLQIPVSGYGMDDAPAQVTYDSVSVPHLHRGEANQLLFSVSSHILADSVIGYLRRGGETDFTKGQLLYDTEKSRWVLQADANQITERGLEYYLEIYHGFRKTVFPPQGAVSPKALSVITPQLVFPGATPGKSYRMISIPGSSGSRSLQELFGDQLGAYDKKEYRLFDCPDGQNYRELESMERKLPAGQAVWLVTNTPQTLLADSIESVKTDQKFAITLHSGWNMIANPFAFDLFWPQNDANHALYYYDGNGWDPVERMQPYEGYAVYARSDSSLELFAREYPAQTGKNSAVLSGDAWRVRLTARDGALYDDSNYAGVAEQVTYNAPEIPPIGSYVSLSFCNVQAVDERLTRYASDYRVPGETGYVFDFEVTTNTHRTVTVNALPFNLPEDMDWRIVCPATAVDYGKEAFEQKIPAQRYQLLVGSGSFIREQVQKFAALPVKFALHPAWPNPFNPQTTVQFELARKSKVAVRIFNSLGQMVQQLQAPTELDAGYYRLNWNGSTTGGQQAAAGVYFLQLKTEAFSKTIKLVLVK